MRRTFLFGMLFALVAQADEPSWETVSTGAITIKSRPRPKSAVREVLAEADFKASVQDIQATLTDVDSFRSFMPYVQTSRTLSVESDGSAFTYSALDLPVVSNRDYVVHVFLDEGVAPDGSGNFRTHWFSVPDHLPKKKGLIRLDVNEGSWKVTPRDDGGSHVIYAFAADPAGMIPTWLVNLGNRRGVPDVLCSIEKEAQRRHAERTRDAGQ